MPFRTSAMPCIVRLIALRGLNATQERVCERVRHEGGRCWAALVTAHKQSREAGGWLGVRELEIMFANGFKLHSQTIQALAQKLDANLATIKELRRRQYELGCGLMEYPFRTPDYQTVPWKDMAIRIIDGNIVLSNGRGNAPLIVALPPEYLQADIRKAELTWRADHYELCLTIDTHIALPPALGIGETAGVDLGEIHTAACVTTSGQGVIISGRLLRSFKRLRNKRHAAYQERLARCTEGSRRWRRLTRRRAQASVKLFRQQRDILHRASHLLLDFCVAQNVARLAVGDVRGIQNGVNLGRNNQKIAQWPHGQFFAYVAYKAGRHGIVVDYIDEYASTKTCSACGFAHTRQARGRVFVCPSCHATLHRDANGAANICSQARYGSYGHVQPGSVRHYQPFRAA